MFAWACCANSTAHAQQLEHRPNGNLGLGKAMAQRRDHKKAPLGWFGGKWFLVRDYAILDSSSMEAMKAFVAGGTAGVLSKTAVAPVERVKLLTQIEGLRAYETRRSISRIALDIWHLEGLQAFWRGNGPTVLRVIPNKGILFMCNDYYISLIRSASGDTLASRFAAGSLSGATSVTFTYPLEVIQSRMASGKYNAGIFDCIRRTWNIDGPRSFYKGYSASLLGIIPYTGSQFFLERRNWVFGRSLWSVRSPENVRRHYLSRWTLWGDAYKLAPPLAKVTHLLGDAAGVFFEMKA